MSPVSTNFGDENGEMCSFRQRFEALVAQLPAESEPIAVASKMEKFRFVHAVMVLANGGEKRGERLKISHKASMDKSSELDKMSWDPIEEALKVLRNTTAMLDKMLDIWSNEGRSGNGREAALWHRICKDTNDATALPVAMMAFDTGRLTSVAHPTRASANSQLGTDIRQPNKTPLSSKISFPSELRKYRMMADPKEEMREEMAE